MGRPTTPIFFVSIGLALLGGPRLGSAIRVSIGVPPSALPLTGVRGAPATPFAPEPCWLPTFAGALALVVALAPGLAVLAKQACVVQALKTKTQKT